MISIIQTPEFWTSFAFVFVLFLSARPVMRYLEKWTQGQAEQIQKRRQEAQDVLKKAEALKKQYETAYQNRQVEQRQMLEAADTEISFLESETQQLTNDRMARKSQEIDLRLRMIEENGRQDIKSKMLARVVSEAQSQLQTLRDTGKLAENTDVLIQQAFEALDTYAAALKNK